MSYTPKELSIVCPKCCAAKGGKCLDSILDRMSWRDTPHAERVQALENLARTGR